MCTAADPAPSFLRQRSRAAFASAGRRRTTAICFGELLCSRASKVLLVDVKEISAVLPKPQAERLLTAHGRLCYRKSPGGNNHNGDGGPVLAVSGHIKICCAFVAWDRTSYMTICVGLELLRPGRSRSRPQNEATSLQKSRHATNGRAQEPRTMWQVERTAPTVCSPQFDAPVSAEGGRRLSFAAACGAVARSAVKARHCGCGEQRGVALQALHVGGWKPADSAVGCHAAGLVGARTVHVHGRHDARVRCAVAPRLCRRLLRGA